MKITIKLKITFQKIARYLYFTAIILAVIAFYLTFNFLYKNFYVTIAQSDEIIILQGQITDEVVNMNKYNTVMKNLEEKAKKRELGSINNPFD